MNKKGIPYIFQALLFGVGLIMPKVELYQKIIGYLCIAGSLLYFIIYFIKTNYKPKFLKSILNKPSNNPDHFVELNIETLKSHLINWINYESYKNIIKKITLYRPSFETNTPTLTKYILYFELKYDRETETTRKIFEEFLGKKTLIIGDDFKNVYKEKTPDHHLEEWYLIARKPGGVYEKYSFVLYP